MYTTNETKLTNILAGVTGSLLCELSCGDISSVKEFRKEVKDMDSFKAYDQTVGTFYNKYLNEYDCLDKIRAYLVDINNLMNYRLVVEQLKHSRITCCGYNETGRSITIYNNTAQLSIDCSKPTGTQIENFLNKWCMVGCD